MAHGFVAPNSDQAASEAIKTWMVRQQPTISQSGSFTHYPRSWGPNLARSGRRRVLIVPCQSDGKYSPGAQDRRDAAGGRGAYWTFSRDSSDGVVIAQRSGGSRAMRLPSFIRLAVLSEEARLGQDPTLQVNQVSQ